MRTESFYKENALSYVGARGLMQIMPYTALHIARRIGHSDFSLNGLWHPLVNIVYGGWYLKYLLTFYQKNHILAAAAYNAGPFAVNAWLARCQSCAFDEYVEAIPYKETRRYVKEVVKTLARYNWIYQGRHKLGHISQLPHDLPAQNDFF